MTLVALDNHPVRYRGPPCRLLAEAEKVWLSIVEGYRDTEFGTTLRGDRSLIGGYAAIAAPAPRWARFKARSSGTRIGSETWGLVVNEILLQGVQCVVSDGRVCAGPR